MDSISLVEIIGTPFGTYGEKDNVRENGELLGLFPLSIKNKIPLLYLDSVKKLYGNLYELQSHYTQLKESEKAIRLQIKDIANILGRKKTDYAVFKTLKPFPYIASDIDLLLFADEGVKEALMAFTESGYRLLDSGPRNFTVFNLESGLKIDLYDEITASNIIYMDKQKIRGYVVSTTLDNQQIPVLNPEVELLCVIAHSFYKEQLYTLADFYAIILNMASFTYQQIDTFIRLAKELRIEFACCILLELTQNICFGVFQSRIKEIQEVIGELVHRPLIFSMSNSTIGHLDKRIPIPYKFNYATIAFGFIDKILKDGKTKRSVLFQVKDFLLDRQFSKGLIERIVGHIIRETY
jgi:hypothetical protein